MNCFFVVLVLVVLDIGINSSAHGIKSQDGGVIVRGLWDLVLGIDVGRGNGQGKGGAVCFSAFADSDLTLAALLRNSRMEVMAE